jgi:hypothetical protein
MIKKHIKADRQAGRHQVGRSGQVTGRSDQGSHRQAGRDDHEAGRPGPRRYRL